MKNKKIELANTFTNNDIAGNVAITSNALMTKDGSGPLSDGSIVKKDKQKTLKKANVREKISL